MNKMIYGSAQTTYSKKKPTIKIDFDKNELPHLFDQKGQDIDLVSLEPATVLDFVLQILAYYKWASVIKMDRFF